MSWSNAYVGTPYEEFGRVREGCDCWGLACVVYGEELHVSLPDYLGYSSVEEHDELATLFAGGKQSPVWVPVTGNAIAFDLAVFRRGRFDAHVGIVVRHGVMLHMAEGDCAKHVSYLDGRWKNRLNGVYRHVEIISRAAS